MVSEERQSDSKPLFVMKFGGTSVGGAGPIERVTNIIDGYSKDRRLVVVISAFRGITDSLSIICQYIRQRDIEKLELGLEDIFYKHAEVIDQLDLPRPFRGSLETKVEALFLQLRRDATVTRLLTADRIDRILSYGERCSVRIVEAKMLSKGVTTQAVDASEIIETDRRFGEAKPDFAKTAVYAQRLLQPLLEANIIPVVTGFIGATKDGKITTLGRGGSDYTASILGKVLNANEVWIWTDVDGIYSADPRYHPDAQLLKELSQFHAHRMAKMGAKVLYTKTMEPLLGTPIVLRVKNTFNPIAEGTVIK